MGLEAETTCTYSGKSFAVKALLESTELILRGGLKRKLALTALKHVTAKGPALTFEADGESFTLNLGAVKATAWAKKISAPPPTLSKKLGLSATTEVLVIGAVDDAELEAALTGHTTSNAKQAALFIAVTRDEAALAGALMVYGKQQAPLWLINVKGPKSALGENAIRAKLRALGFKDTKTCAVSATLSGTRYSRQK